MGEPKACDRNGDEDRNGDDANDASFLSGALTEALARVAKLSAETQSQNAYVLVRGRQVLGDSAGSLADSAPAPANVKSSVTTTQAAQAAQAAISEGEEELPLQRRADSMGRTRIPKTPLFRGSRDRRALAQRTSGAGPVTRVQEFPAALRCAVCMHPRHQTSACPLVLAPTAGTRSRPSPSPSPSSSDPSAKNIFTALRLPPGRSGRSGPSGLLGSCLPGHPHVLDRRPGFEHED